MSTVCNDDSMIICEECTPGVCTCDVVSGSWLCIFLCLCSLVYLFTDVSVDAGIVRSVIQIVTSKSRMGFLTHKI